MERIVIEVDDATAKNWRMASQKKRVEIEKRVNLTITKELMKDNKQDFIQFMDEIRDKMEERGLTQEILDDILKDD